MGRLPTARDALARRCRLAAEAAFRTPGYGCTPRLRPARSRTGLPCQLCSWGSPWGKAQGLCSGHICSGHFAPGQRERLPRHDRGAVPRTNSAAGASASYTRSRRESGPCIYRRVPRGDRVTKYLGLYSYKHDKHLSRSRALLVFALSPRRQLTFPRAMRRRKERIGRGWLAVSTPLCDSNRSVRGYGWGAARSHVMTL